MSAYRIRPARLEDIPVLVHHRRAMFSEMGLPGDYSRMEREFAGWAREGMAGGIFHGFLALAESGEVAAGGALSLLPWPPSPADPGHRLAFVYNVYTEPAHRRKGLARQFMEVMHAWCRERGIRTIALHASDFGRPLYEAMGYRPTSEMRLRLTAPGLSLEPQPGSEGK